MDEKPQSDFEARSRALFERSVENLDMRLRSRLTQARHAALASAAPRARFTRRAWWMPATGMALAALLGVSLWTGSPLTHRGVSSADAQNTFEDLDIVAAADDGNNDAIDMLQDDIDFYDFADKAAGADSAV